MTTLAAELGRGAEISEIRSAYEKATASAAPASLTAEVTSLLRRGLLERTGGRAGRTLYAPAGSGVEGAEADDDALKVLRALGAAHRGLGRAVSTREVGLELKSLGLSLSSQDPNAVRRRLQTLAGGRTRGPQDMRAPQVQRVDAQAATGAPSAHWVPAGGTGRVAPRSRTDALRQAIASTARDLGRPVSRRELRWWLRTPSAISALGGVVASPTKISAELGRVARQDASHAGEPGRVHTVTTPFTCHGGGEPRYALGPTPHLEAALCSVEDALQALRPADELHGAWVLARRADLARSEALGLMAAERNALLSALAYQLCEAFSDRAHLVHRCRLAGQVLASWLKGARMTDLQRDAWLRRVDERAHQLETVAKVVAEPPLDVQPSFGTVGSSATVTFRAIEPLLDTAVLRLGIKPRNRRNLIAQARRFPVEDSPGLTRFGRAGALPLATLDRVDVLAGLWHALSAPRGRVLTLNAHIVLGHILRDAGFVASLLRLTPAPLADDRRTLIVALGLLGEVPPLESTVDTTDSEDVAAWTLAAILATLGQAEPVLEQALSVLGGPVRHTVDVALMRIELGYPFTAIE